MLNNRVFRGSINAVVDGFTNMFTVKLDELNKLNKHDLGVYL